MPSEIGEQALFKILNIIGLLLLSLALASALVLANIKRLHTWFSFIVSWITFCLSFLVLANQPHGQNPAFEICLFQAALIYAAPPFAAAAAACFLFEVYLRLSSALCEVDPRPKFVLLLLLTPPFVHILIFTEALLIGLRDFTTVRLEPAEMYCHITNGVPEMITSGLVLAILAIAIVLMALIAITFYRHWAAFKKIRRRDPISCPFGLSVLIRIVVFILFALCAVGLTVYAARDSTNASVTWNLMLSTMPIIAALVLGTHMDVMRGWLHFSKRQEKLGPNQKSEE